MTLLGRWATDLRVSRSALQNGASVAGLLLTTNTLIAEEQTPWGGSRALMTEYGQLDEGLHQPSPDSSTPQSLGLGPSVGERRVRPAGAADDRRLRRASTRARGGSAVRAQRRRTRALRSRGRMRERSRLLGPAFVAAVAYIDPGNFATNLAAGAQFGYALVWVVVARQPDGNAGAVPVRQGRRGDRTRPAGAVPRALPARGVAWACGCRPS